ncbi:hypothetical protein L1I79_27410 [Strepomyces sp. STD 3.1]|nr:hypothetical protein [Streptomyces sp. STD 3.1]
MAALAKATVRCPGCDEPLDLSLLLDEDAKPAPGEIVLKVDRRIVDQHIVAAHTDPEAGDG